MDLMDLNMMGRAHAGKTHFFYAHVYACIKKYMYAYKAGDVKN